MDAYTQKLKDIFTGKTIVLAKTEDIISCITTWDEEIAFAVVRYDARFFNKVPLRFRTQDMYILAVQLRRENLKLVSNKMLLHRFEDFLKVSPNETANLLDEKALAFLFKNKAKLKRVIDALPRPLSNGVAMQIVKALLVRTYDKKLLEWIEEKYPSDWERIVEQKKAYDTKYRKDMDDNPEGYWDVTEHGPSTKHGIRVTWVMNEWYYDSDSDDGWYDDEPRNREWEIDNSYPYRDYYHTICSNCPPFH